MSTGRNPSKTLDSSIHEKLISTFHLNEKTVYSLQSPNLVAQRLEKIVLRGKIKSRYEHELYQQYCAGDHIDADFIFLLDTNKEWFKHYFSNHTLFFLNTHLYYASAIGHGDLVKFLVEECDCVLKEKHFRAGIASGDLELVKYLLGKESSLSPQILLHEAILSGNVDTLSHLIIQLDLTLEPTFLRSAILSNSIEMMTFFHKQFNLKTFEDDEFKKITPLIDSICFSDIKNGKILPYLIEKMKWSTPIRSTSTAAEIIKAAYLSGIIEWIIYTEKKFPSIVIEPDTLLESAIKSDSLTVVKYFLEKKMGITAENFSHIYKDDQSVLSKALQSNNPEIAGFFVEEYGLKPTREDLLLLTVKSSCSVTNAQALMIGYHYPVTNDVFEQAFLGKNFELISFLYQSRHHFNIHSVMDHVIHDPSCFMAINHLITKENYQPRDSLLDKLALYRSTSYQKNIEENRLIFDDFIVYLINILKCSNNKKFNVLKIENHSKNKKSNVMTLFGDNQPTVEAEEPLKKTGKTFQ